MKCLGMVSDNSRTAVRRWGGVGKELLYHKV